MNKRDDNLFNDDDEKKMTHLLMMRNGLLREREKVLKILLPLMDEEHKIALQLDDINMQMCEIQGHKFEDRVIKTKQYGDTYKCLMCHKLVALNDVRPRDTFAVKEDNKKVRILYKK